MDDILTSGELDLLRSRGRQQQFAAGDYLMHAGDEAQSIYLLLSGSVAVLSEDAQGNELCVNILGSGSFFGELGLCESDWRRSAAIRARKSSTVLELDYGCFLSLANDNNELFLRIIRQLSRKLHEMTTRARQFVHMNATERVLYVLRDLAGQVDAEQTQSGILLAVAKREIANMAGCSRETVSRALQELEATGAIENTGRKVLLKHRH